MGDVIRHPTNHQEFEVIDIVSSAVNGKMWQVQPVAGGEVLTLGPNDMESMEVV